MLDPIWFESSTLWKKSFDPYVSVYPVHTSSFLPLVLSLPNAKISIHIALYLPTYGKDTEFVSELANLQTYHDPIIFIRGDGNANHKNITRIKLLNHLISMFTFSKIDMDPQGKTTRTRYKKCRVEEK